MGIFHQELKLAVIGLGYVGLPLAVEFAKRREVVGFDINASRIESLRNLEDATQEVSKKDLALAEGLILTDSPERLKNCTCFIVTVPTPIDKNKFPDLRPLKRANEIIGRFLKEGDIVIYESTVYPGCTEEVSVPLLEKISGLRFNENFFCGYSPERINPGDRDHRLVDIVKVTSGSSPEIATLVDQLYASIITAGTHRAETIKVAEAAKVIENTQRDLNIALVNELAIILNRMNIDTGAVLEAASSKWNFIPFQPGLVGGHCIGVDPYYLTYKAQVIGYEPDIILAGRRLNDGMGSYIVSQLKRVMQYKGIQIKKSSVLIMGLTFKENCPDLRNTQVARIFNELTDFDANVDVHDPLANSEEAKRQYGISLIGNPTPASYDAILLAVAHSEFEKMGEKEIRKLGKKNHVLYDIRNILPPESSDLRL